jgi:hypothetical protein
MWHMLALVGVGLCVVITMGLSLDPLSHSLSISGSLYPLP